MNTNKIKIYTKKSYIELIYKFFPEYTYVYDFVDVDMHTGGEVLIAGTEQYTAEWFDERPWVRLVLRTGSGRDNIPISLDDRGIKVITHPEKTRITVSEWVLKHTLNHLSRIYYDPPHLTWHKNISEISFGVVGFGNIGFSVSNIIGHFGCKNVLWYDNDPKVVNKFYGSSTRAKCSSLYDVLTCDVVSYHIPMSPENGMIVDRRVFSNLKDGALFLNSSRGEIMNYVNLCEYVDQSDRNVKFVIDDHKPQWINGTDGELGYVKRFDEFVEFTKHTASQTLATRKAQLKACLDDIQAYDDLCPTEACDVMSEEVR